VLISYLYWLEAHAVDLLHMRARGHVVQLKFSSNLHPPPLLKFKPTHSRASVLKRNISKGDHKDLPEEG
jgi:hypothetical protein